MFILVIYRKDNGEVIHYVEHNLNVQPTLFGLYHACIKKNHPLLKLDDIDSFIIDSDSKDENKQTNRDKLFKNKKVKVNVKNGKFDGIECIEKGKSDPPEPSKEEKKMKQLEDTIANQQKAIDELMKLVKDKNNNKTGGE